MRGAAACLKVQINNDLPVIHSYIDNYIRDLQGLQYEQTAVFSLLYDCLGGDGEWDLVAIVPPLRSDPRTLIGTVIYPPSNGIGESIAPTIAMAAFNEYTLKLFLKSFDDGSDRGLPVNWRAMVDATPVDGLQALINTHGGFDNYVFYYTELLIRHEPATLTLHRCTEQEIEGLFIGDHNPHLDVFDCVKEMLVGDWSALNTNGLSQAVYDQATDTIIFKSDFSVIATPFPA